MNLLIADLDDTLIDTQGHKDRIFKKLAQACGIDVSKVRQLYEETKKSTQPEKSHLLLADKLAKLSNIDQNSLLKIIFSDVPNIKVKQNVLDFIKKFRGRKLIFTFGDVDFQRLKVKELDLAKYFDGVSITDQSKISQMDSLVDGYEEVWIIDNKPDFISEVNAKYPKIKTFTPTQIS